MAFKEGEEKKASEKIKEKEGWVGGFVEGKVLWKETFVERVVGAIKTRRADKEALEALKGMNEKNRRTKRKDEIEGLNAKMLRYARIRDKQSLVHVVDAFAEGADINAKDSSGYTALMEAIGGGNEDIVEFLIDAGADVNARNSDKQTPLILSAVYGNKNIAELLIKNGADINAKGEKGRTALMVAVKYSPEEFVKFLIDKGADLEAKDDQGWTALMWAGCCSKSSLFDLFLEKKVNPFWKDSNGRTIVDLHGHLSKEFMEEFFGKYINSLEPNVREKMKNIAELEFGLVNCNEKILKASLESFL